MVDVVPDQMPPLELLQGLGFLTGLPPVDGRKLEVGTETWVYILRGRVEHWYGAHLETSMKNTPGDLPDIEAGTPHKP